MESARIFRKRLQRLGIVFTFLFRIVVCIFPIIEFITQEEVLRSIQKAQIISFKGELFFGKVWNIRSRFQLKIWKNFFYTRENLIIREAFAISQRITLVRNTPIQTRRIQKINGAYDFRISGNAI